MAERIGQRLGNYRLIGKGGFAEVYLGEHLRLNTQAAIKVLHTRLAGAEEVDAFQQEAQTIAHLVHPHIVRVLDFDVEEDTPFLVMDYAPNGTLRQRHPKGTILTPAAILPYVKEAAEALQYAHDKKLIHRDIKPENFLLGESEQVLLSDFGIALVAQSSRYQNTQEVVGTMAYMAPEQLQGHPRPASDQYALAITVYEWLTGARPFHGSFSEIFSQQMFVQPAPLRSKIPTVSGAVEEVVLTALAKDPKQRFGSLRAFANAFEQACQAEALLSAPTQFISPSGPISQPTAGITPATPAPAPSTILTPPAPSTPPASALPSTIAVPPERKPIEPVPVSASASPTGQIIRSAPAISAPAETSATPPVTAALAGASAPPQPAAPRPKGRLSRHNVLMGSVALALILAVVVGVLIHNATGFQPGQVTTGSHITSIQTGTGVDGSIQGETNTFHAGDEVFVVFTVSNGNSGDTLGITLYDSSNTVVYSVGYTDLTGTETDFVSTPITQTGVYQWEVDYNGTTAKASITFQVVS